MNNKNNVKNNLVGNGVLLLAAFVWGFAMVGQDILGNYLNAFATNAIRFIIGFFALALIMPLLDYIRKNNRKTYSFSHGLPLDLTKRELFGGMITGSFLFLATNLQQLGLNDANTGPGKASFLTVLYIIFVPILGVLRKRKIEIRVWFAVVIAIIGVYLLTMGGKEEFSFAASDIVLLLCAVAFSFHIYSIEIIGNTVDGVRMSMVQFLVAGLLSMPFMFGFGVTLNGQNFGDIIGYCIPSLLYLGLGSCGIAYTLQIIGQQLADSPTVSTIVMSMESVFGALGGVIITKENMSPFEWSGCGVIFIAVIIAQIPIESFFAQKSK
ncbi:MAG: DMT family transporter [Coriobacteriales bacterium]|nr:DMT family transporter [Coriobacteriales bacterium]